ncbi:MAG: hypothetical protein AAF694_01605 [Bacteroidota bacterium]
MSTFSTNLIQILRNVKPYSFRSPILAILGIFGLGVTSVYSQSELEVPSYNPADQESPCDMPLFRPIEDSIPKLILNLGASPQFDLLRSLDDPETMLNRIKGYESRGTKADVEELNNLLKCIGYTNGITDERLTEASLAKQRFYRGTMGMLGNNRHEYEFSLISNDANKGVIEAWKIMGVDTTDYFFIMSDCGNAFFPGILDSPQAGRFPRPFGGPIPPPVEPCPECDKDQILTLQRTDYFELADEETLRDTMTLPIYANTECCRGKSESLTILDSAIYIVDLKGETYMRDTITTRLSGVQNEACEDSFFQDLGNGPLHQMSSQINLSATPVQTGGLVLPGLSVITYNDNILRFSVGTEFGEDALDERNPVTNEIERNSTLRPMYSFAIGLEKYIGNCFYIAIDGLYGRKEIDDVIFGPRRTDSLNIPSPLEYLGLSPTLLYDIKNCGNGLKIGLGPHILLGTNTADGFSEADFSYSALGVHGEVAYPITQRIELFGQIGFNNHKYRNFNTRAMEGRIGAKYIFSPNRKGLKEARNPQVIEFLEQNSDSN